jgi:hypothetical protein
MIAVLGPVRISLFMISVSYEACVSVWKAVLEIPLGIQHLMLSMLLPIKMLYYFKGHNLEEWIYTEERVRFLLV